ILIKELDGQTIYEKKSQEKKPIASLTKLFTAFIALENYPTEEIFYIKENFVKNQDAEKNTKFKGDEKYNLEQLLNALLISSSNIAAWSIIDKIGKENFLKKIEEILSKNNLFHTKIIEPSGVSIENTSNLKDLYNFSKVILRDYPEIFEISRKKEYLIKSPSNNRYIYNTNYLLSKYDQYIIGSKTGFTSKAGQCLILIIKYPQSPIIFLGFLDSHNRDKDAEYLIEKLRNIYE
ncbi:MAG: serine hydrolase, partial [Patescibacteria group bacterium]|nr:serine hydrolase [Patescibacteria group bacterium]